MDAMSTLLGHAQNVKGSTWLFIQGFVGIFPSENKEL